MGPRLLYALIVGAVIAAALALRIWDPSPVARLRALVFDTYQQISPRQFDPGLPLRIVDIDEESLKRVGQWPWPRTVLAELVKKLSDNGAAAVGFDMVFPEPDRMSPANALRFWPQSDALAGLARRGREASLQRSGLCRSHRARRRRARLHRHAARRLAPASEGRLRPWRRRPAPVRPGLSRRRGKPAGTSGQGGGRRLAQLAARARPDHPPPAHGGSGRRQALSLLRRRHAAARARRLDLHRQVVRREQREGVRREDRHRQSPHRRLRGSDRSRR